MQTSVVVPIFNGIRYLPAFLHSLQMALPHDSQLIFIDDGSTEPVLDALPEFRSDLNVIRLKNEQNLGYSVAVNRGFAACTGDIIVQLNTDLILDSACITSMLDLIKSQSNIGVVGSKLIFPTTNLVQHIGMAFGRFNIKHIYYQLPVDHPLCCKTRPMQILTGATVAMTRQVLEQIGPLDERYFNYNEDIDHCLKASKLGLVNYTCAESKAYHWVSQSGPSRFARTRASDAIFWSTWHNQYKIDLPNYVREALCHVLNRDSHLEKLDFEGINLCRSGDDEILFAEVGQFWPLTVAEMRQHRQVNNAEEKYWMPMVLPHWLQHNPKPFIYFVDRFRQLSENILWFQNRLQLVRDEIIVDTTGSVVTVSEMLGWGSGS